MANIKIPLMGETIDNYDIENLIIWLRTKPRLTKDARCLEFEDKWSGVIGRKHSVFVNSGSSANLAMLYSLKLSGRMKNDIIIAPAVSWTTTVAPIIQLGMTPYLCECDKDTLGVDVEHLEKLFKQHHPSALIIVHVLGFPCKMDDIQYLCEKHDVILLEDSCESVGSKYKDTITGGFGLMSSFSTYFGHHFSTIEGGIVSTDDDDMNNILLSIRSHGWGRDWSEEYRNEQTRKHGIDDFRALYSFYYPGFNIRPTELGAVIGLGQLDKLRDMNRKRITNFYLYDTLIKEYDYKIRLGANRIVNFGYPVISDKRADIAKELGDNGVECRPLICGNIGRQPYWVERYGETRLPFADIIHNYGMYVPNNHQITEEQIAVICSIINKYL